MQIEVVQAPQADAPALAALAELYIYEFTEFTDEDVGDDGGFGSDWLARYWTEPDSHAFIVRVEGRLAGFALVSRISEFEDGTQPWSMSEFFVMRKYRRHGVGRVRRTHAGRREAPRAGADL